MFISRKFGGAKLVAFGGLNLSPQAFPLSSPLQNPSIHCGDITIFQDGGRRHVGFLKFSIFIGRCGPGGRDASLCEISSKMVKRFLRYHNVFIFQDGGRRHLGFQKFSNVLAEGVWRAEMLPHAKFRPTNSR